MPPVQGTQLGIFAVLLSAVLFGTTGTVLVNAPEGADAATVGALRLLIGGLTLVVLARRQRRSTGPATGRQRMSTAAAIVGALGVATFQFGYFLAVERTGVAVGTVVTIGSGPVVAGVIDAVRARTLPPQAWTLGTAVSVAGVAILGVAGRDAAADLVGVVLAVTAGAGWATFATVGRSQITRGVPSTTAMATMFCGGAVLLAPLLVTGDTSWVGSPGGVAVALYLGVVTVGVAYWSYGVALRHLPAPTVITLTLLEPITAALLGALVVHEGIRPAGWVGIALVLAGLLVTARGSLSGEGSTATVAA